MTRDNWTTGDESAEPSSYELMVNGELGPVIQSCFPDFSTLAVNSHSVLTGSCPGPDEFRLLLDRLDALGFPPTVIYLDRHRSATAAGPASQQ